MTKANRKPLSDKELNWGVTAETSSDTTIDNDKDEVVKPNSLLGKMIQKPKAKKKFETTRFTFDLDDDMQRKLTNLANHTNRSKASVLKFLINEAHKELE